MIIMWGLPQTLEFKCLTLNLLFQVTFSRISVTLKHSDPPWFYREASDIPQWMNSVQLKGKYISANVSFQGCGNANQPKNPIFPCSVCPALYAESQNPSFCYQIDLPSPSLRLGWICLSIPSVNPGGSSAMKGDVTPFSWNERSPIALPRLSSFGFLNHLKGIKQRGNCSLPCLFVYLWESHFSVAFFFLSPLFSGLA